MKIRQRVTALIIAVGLLAALGFGLASVTSRPLLAKVRFEGMTCSASYTNHPGASQAPWPIQFGNPDSHGYVYELTGCHK